jgi:tetratricopeptide (TPR) repeat protein
VKKYFFVILAAGILFQVLRTLSLQKSRPLILTSDEIIFSDGADLPSTAGSNEKRVIRTLIKSLGRAEEIAELEIDYPLDESICPPEMTPPTFLWHDQDSQADLWLIDLSFENSSQHIYVLVPGKSPPKGEIDPRCVTETIKYEPTPYQSSARAWTPSAELWSYFKDHSAEKPGIVAFFGFSSKDPTNVLSSGHVSMTASQHPAGAPIFYRDVPLIPSQTKLGVIKPLAEGSVPLIAWRLRDISKPESRIVLKDIPTCSNCHSFSLDGKFLGMDLDGPDGDKGAYLVSPIAPQTVVTEDHIITWNSFKNKPAGKKTIGFLSQVSPDGRYVVSTVNESLYVSNFADFQFLQVFFPTRGILAYFSKETGEINALPGADDPEYVQCDPAWSPDGKYVVFARASAKDPYRPGQELAKYANDPLETEIQYDLYRLEFNEGKGGVPTPITGASQNGMSNSFPKVSPDGKWIVFVRSKNGQLMRPDGKLWIVPFEGGEAKLMRCNTSRMNSWHSFSPNGRWMVFSSKSNSPYTQMFLTHIDDNGNDSPPILVPNSTASNRAVNIPEFVNIPYDGLKNIDVPVLEYRLLSFRGYTLFKEGKMEEAISQLLKSIELNPDYDQARYNLGIAFYNLKKYDQAIEHLQKAVSINPQDAEALLILGKALFFVNKSDDAIEPLKKSLEVDPDKAEALFYLGNVLKDLNRFDEAIPYFRKAQRIDPGNIFTCLHYGETLIRLGRFEEAVKQFKKALEIDPNNARAHLVCGNALFSIRELDEAIEHYKAALEGDPTLADAHLNWGNVLFGQKKYEEAIEHYKKVLEINPNDRDAYNNIELAEEALRRQSTKE